jgi:hypothetical protein
LITGAPATRPCGAAVDEHLARVRIGGLVHHFGGLAAYRQAGREFEQRAQAGVLGQQPVGLGHPLGLPSQLLACGVFVLQRLGQAVQVVAAAAGHLDGHQQCALDRRQRRGQRDSQRGHDRQPCVGNHQEQRQR